MSDAGIQRVVVRLDAVSDSAASIEAAAAISARWRARLHGLFIEDADLLGIAELPFTRQTGLSAAGTVALDAAALAADFRLAARHAHDLLAAAAGQRGLDWSFRVVRGSIAEAFDHPTQGDFIVAHADALPFARHVRIAPSRRVGAAELGRPMLLLRHGKRTPKQRVVALLDRGPTHGGAPLLRAAAELASARAWALTILGQQPDVDTAEIDAWIKQAAPRDLPIEIETSAGDAETLQRRVVALDCGLLALGASAPADLMDPPAANAPYDLLLVD